jgi:hypothetical protein
VQGGFPTVRTNEIKPLAGISNATNESKVCGSVLDPQICCVELALLHDYTPNTRRTGFSFWPVPKERFVVTLSGSTYVPKSRSHMVNRLARFFM